ncbi:tho complex subunit 1, partial [Plakobranchus ocellatus]
LLNLQLNDSNFRRYVLVQFLIIFQYLKATVKFKTQVHTLTDEQSEWLKDSQQEVFNLLKETPPHGELFCEAVKNRPTEEVKAEVAVAEEDDDIKENNDEEEDMKNEEQDETNPPTQFSAEEIQSIAQKLGDSWMKLGQKLNFPADDLAYFKDSSETSTAAAVSMITVWQEEDPERDTISIVYDALADLGLKSILQPRDSP